MISDDDPEAPLKEIWEIRRRMMAEFDNDPRKFGQYLTELQNTPELRPRVVSLEQLESRRSSAA
ncbi:MAG: hypothetical protein JO306_08575 [Gemmatimonadetes bacterium]|nr:hypothetical protein [Gemmatimonadota bacterium]